MISKKMFIKSLKILQTQFQKEQKLNKQLHETFLNGYSIITFNNLYFDLVIDLIADRFKRDIKNELISFIENERRKMFGL